ncbi:MAG TPA: hypothetical protein VFT29_02070 [Gemmatimonadaceae bacterium]|nr:hypothetical protein [Gemmatimonadaceae bacterium]
MIELAGAWLSQQAARVQDTVVMKTVAVPRNWFESVTDIASGILVLILLALVIGMIPVLFLLRRSLRRARELLDKLHAEVTPLIQHATGAANNVERITASLREDVDRVSETIASANRRLNGAMKAVETRLGEFGALVDVVQEEAEQAFVSTASAVRGVRTGAAALGESDTDSSSGGDEDGDDDEPFDGARESTQGRAGERTRRRGASARPRVRPRRGAQD